MNPAFDYSTIDQDKVRKYPVYRPRDKSYQVDRTWGAGCAFDPPGYPTYFLKSIYNAGGNHPGKGPCAVLDAGEAGLRELPEGDHWGIEEGAYRRLYRPLPLDHPRVKLWLLSVARHFRHCYRDEERPEYGRAGTLIYPLPYYKLKDPHIDKNWTAAYQRAVKEEAHEFNKMENERAARIATPDNHQGVIYVRKIYPGFAAPAWFFEPPAEWGYPAQWWEVMAEPPNPCVGNLRHLDNPWVHRDDNCQWCGAGRKPANPDLIEV